MSNNGGAFCPEGLECSGLRSAVTWVPSRLLDWRVILFKASYQVVECAPRRGVLFGEEYEEFIPYR